MFDHKTELVTFIAAGTYTGNAASTGKNCSAYRELSIYVNATAAGTTLDLTVQDSPDDTTYYTLAALTQITGTGKTVARYIGTIGQYVRISQTAVGTWGYDVQAIFKT